MTSCPRHGLSDDAFGYARAQLWLARALERPLARELTSARFSASTFADAATDQSRLSQFTTGGALCSPAALLAGIAALVRDAMARDASTQSLVPDPLASANDPFLREVNVPWVGVDDAVYYLQDRAEPERVAAAWTQAASASGALGLVTAAPLERGAVTPDSLALAAQRTTLLVITAYDGDGVIAFERRTRPREG